MARLISTWAALVALLAATIVVSFLPIGAWRQVGSLAIAIAKAGLIGWLFMDLKRESPLVRLAAMAAIVLLLVMTAMLGADIGLRPPR